MQKTCLRLVYEHLQSKEIARQLGLSRYTVESHIKSARARLGATTRLEAARLLIATEGESNPPLQTSSPLNAIPSDITPSLTPSSEFHVGTGSEDEQAAAPWGSNSRLYKSLPLPRFWGEQNDLSSAQRLMWIVTLTILICLSLGAVMTSLQALATIL